MKNQFLYMAMVELLYGISILFAKKAKEKVHKTGGLLEVNDVESFAIGLKPFPDFELKGWDLS